jgi:hypothetical protein
MTHWWRAYDDAIDNPKLLKLSDSMHRAWFTLQCIASSNGGALPPTGDIAVRLRLKPAKVAEWITKLVQAKLMDNENGVFRPHNWDDRQFKTDGSDPTNSKRQKRFRERHRNGSNGVTVNASNDVTDKRPEQNIADSEAEHSRADARELDEIGLKQEGLLRAAFTAECAGRPKAPDMAIIKTWLLDGITVGIISKTVPPIIRRKLDMASLSYCDAAVRSEHAKSPGAAAGLQVVSQQVFIVEGTMEWACWEQHLRSTTGRGSPVTDNRDENGRLRRGWFRQTIVPEGYDEATGERIAPASEERVA